jgi:uncharacterized protein GlcG (DUF336 family)
MVTLEHARKIIAAAETKANEVRRPMNIAVAAEGTENSAARQTVRTLCP